MGSIIIVGVETLPTVEVFGEEPLERRDDAVVIIMKEEPQGMVWRGDLTKGIGLTATTTVNEQNRVPLRCKVICKLLQFGKTTQCSKRNTHFTLDHLTLVLKGTGFTVMSIILGLEG